MANKGRILILGSILLASSTQAVELQEPAVKPAVQDSNTQSANFQASAAAAEKWLAVLDAGKYPETWNDASATLKIKLPQESWIKIMEAMRKPLGTVKSRKIIEQIPKVDPQGLPKGEYMIILYNSSFANKNDVKELVILQQESNGEWRILTYQSS